MLKREFYIYYFSIYKKRVTQLNIKETGFLTEKMVKKGYHGNDCFGLAWDRIEVRQTNLFITTLVHMQTM